MSRTVRHLALGSFLMFLLQAAVIAQQPDEPRQPRRGGFGFGGGAGNLMILQNDAVQKEL
jgi:hypothetical protein